VLMCCEHWCLIIKPYWSVPRSRIVKWLLLSFTISPPLISLLPSPLSSHPPVGGEIVVLRITFCQAAMISKIFCFQTDHLKDGISDRVIIMPPAEQSGGSRARRHVKISFITLWEQWSTDIIRQLLNKFHILQILIPSKLKFPILYVDICLR